MQLTEHRKNPYINAPKIVVGVIVLTLLIIMPAPLLPPHRLAETVQSILTVNWKTAYLVAAIGIQAIFWCSLGILAASVVTRHNSPKKRLLQMIIVPAIVVVISLIIRSAKTSHPPIWINAAVPTVSCIIGVWIGLGFLYKRGALILAVVTVVAGVTMWNISGSHDAKLTKATAKHLRRLVAEGSRIPAGEERFMALYQIAFSPPADTTEGVSAVEHNRAAILALGIALGDARIAKFLGLSRDSDLVRQAALLTKKTSLRSRNDWSKHFSLSAALAIIENPLVSDAAGLMKEQLDALGKGTGFSFGDFAADRAGVRFSLAATNSEDDAAAMQKLVTKDFDVSNILPPIDDLPENLTPEQFRSEYGSVGSKAYRTKINEIEKRLDSCIALTPLISGREN